MFCDVVLLLCSFVSCSHDVHYHYLSNGGPTQTRETIPIAPIYIITTDGTLDGAVGNPIIEFYNGGGDLSSGYSDYVLLHLVTAPDGYEANSFKSVGDVIDSGATITVTGSELCVRSSVNLLMVSYCDDTLTSPYFSVSSSYESSSCSFELYAWSSCRRLSSSSHRSYSNLVQRNRGA